MLVTITWIKNKIMKLTQITQILDLQPIKGADRIERAKVLGWDVVVRKGLHQIGDKVIFVFPDTNIPKKYVDESYEGDDKVRLKTIKMKGQYSAGLILPISILAPVPPQAWEDGQDVAELLGIEKWEAPISPQLSGVALGGFPSIVSKTDEDNYRSNPEALEELKDERFKGQEFYLSVKKDGTSATFILDPNGGTFRVCSRNLELKENEGNTHWKMARQYNLENILRYSGSHYAIQGEICGEGIQGNPMCLKGNHLFVFLIKDLDTNTWLDWDSTIKFCDNNSIPHVWELYPRFTVEDMPSWDELQTIANKAKYTGDVEAEGIVLRPVHPIPSNVLGKSWWSVKIINQIYDMKKG